MRAKRNQQIRVYQQYAGIALAALAVLILLYCLIANSYRHKFLKNTYINEFDVSGLTADETEALLKESVENYQLKLIFQDQKKETLGSSAFGLTYISSGEVETLLANQKRMTFPAHFLGKKSTYEVETAYHFDPKQVEKAIAALPEFQADNVTSPADAYIRLNNASEFEIVPEVEGNELDSDVVNRAAEAAIHHGTKTLDLTKTEDAYKRPLVRSDSEELSETLDSLNQFIATTVTLSLNDGKKSRARETISTETLISWISTGENGALSIDSGHVADKCWSLVQRLANRYNDTSDHMTFHATRLGDKTLYGEVHGYKIDVDAVAEQLCQDVLTGKSEEIVIQNSVSETADPTFGGTYIEVDITNQHVFFYKDGSLYLDTDCVTGLESDPDRKTPSGLFYIYGKDENKTLEGRLTADGPVTYSSDVDCWMPFYESYGLHDAPWREKFGGSIYLEEGSHGCVNLPVDAAKKIFNNAPVGTPVIVLRESDS